MWEINFDESCVESEHDFMVLGGICASCADMQEMGGRIDDWRGDALRNYEFKWNKVARGKIQTYREFVNGGMDWIMGRKRVVFAAASFDLGQVDCETFWDGNEDKQLYRLMCLPILHKLVPRIPEGERISLYVDYRIMADYSLSDLRWTLNDRIAKRYGYARNIVVSVEPRDSAVSNPMQMSDVLLGAVGYHCNRRDLMPSANAKRTALASRIAKLAGMPNLRAATPVMSRFSVWPVDFTKGKRRNAPKPT